MGWMKNNDSQNSPASKYWFRQKTYGYGVTPCSAKGWLATLLFAVVVAGGGIYLFGGSEEPPAIHVVYFLTYVGVLVAVFFRLTKSKTEGELAWRWGKKD